MTAKTQYVLTTANGGTVFSRKERAVAAGELLGESFTVHSPAGKLVHEYTAPVEAPAVKVCKKDPSHEWRVTKSGGYCYTEDRVIAERQKAERAAARAAKTEEAAK